MIEIEKDRAIQLLKNAIEDIRDSWSSGYADVINATGITAEELISLGYNADEIREDMNNM